MTLMPCHMPNVARACSVALMSSAVGLALVSKLSVDSSRSTRRSLTLRSIHQPAPTVTSSDNEDDRAQAMHSA